MENKTEKVIFPDRSQLDCITRFHKEGGVLKQGQKIFLERNARTELIPAELISWDIGEVKCDITGYGKYSNSTALVELEGRTVIWPFSMIYITKP